MGRKTLRKKARQLEIFDQTQSRYPPCWSKPHVEKRTFDSMDDTNPIVASDIPQHTFNKRPRAVDISGKYYGAFFYLQEINKCNSVFL
jgi:hypothetical protein